MLDTLYKKAEKISDGIASSEQTLLKLAKALNPACWTFEQNECEQDNDDK